MIHDLVLVGPNPTLSVVVTRFSRGGRVVDGSPIPREARAPVNRYGLHESPGNALWTCPHIHATSSL
ncbi:hypothetical protein [Synechococcus sp. MIT S1220]|uniref:hypothetical protein n=1 Tax=Synechococcus sp. MIT S1220 TaxID=3082549 RepID=UPI0039B0591B